MGQRAFLPKWLRDAQFAVWTWEPLENTSIVNANQRWTKPAIKTDVFGRMVGRAARTGMSAPHETRHYLPLGAAYFFPTPLPDRKSTRLNSSHANISYAVFCLKTK